MRFSLNLTNHSPLAWGLPLLLSSTLLACSDDGVEQPPPDTSGGGGSSNQRSTKSVFELLADNELTALSGAISGTSLQSLLSESGPYTVLAPNDSALSGASLPTDTALLENLLLHHVLPFEAQAAQILQSTTLRTATNLRVEVTKGDTPQIDGVSVLDTDILGANGVIHVLDGVLPLENIPTFVSSSTELSILAEAVAASNETQSALAAASARTLFAPVNEAFVDVDVQALLANPNLADILGYHVVEGQVTIDGLRQRAEDGAPLTTLTGDSLSVAAQAGGGITLLDGASRTINVQSAGSIRLSNGIVHLIDDVLSPPVDAVDLAETLTRTGFSTLNGLIASSEFAGAATSSSSQLTVFAPTDEAFMAPGLSLPTDQALVDNILAYHIAGRTLRTTELARQSSVLNIANANVAVDFANDPPIIGAALLGPLQDVVASNGIVHEIDTVLVPPAISTEIAVNAQLETFETALASASTSIRDLFEEDGPITVFAPINEAFAEVNLAALASDTVRLDGILAYHIASGQRLSSSLEDGSVLSMSNGVALTVRIGENGVTLESSGLGEPVQVVATDMRLSNGVIHLVDGILNPGNVLEQAQATGATRIVELISNAGLTNALVGSGPVTFFAPSNEALSAFTDEFFEGLSDYTFGSILTSHVLDTEAATAELQQLMAVQTLAGIEYPITGNVAVGGVFVGLNRDIASSNGVLHLMDGVIIPPTVRSMLEADGRFSDFLTAIDRLDTFPELLSPDVLMGAQPFTILAPTNDAFAAAGVDVTTASINELTARLDSHFLVSVVRFGSFINGRRLDSRAGRLDVRVVDTAIEVENSRMERVTAVSELPGIDGVAIEVDRLFNP